MTNAKATSTDIVSGQVSRAGGSAAQAVGGGVFHVVCLDASGNVKWDSKSPNLVVNVGLQDMAQQYFKGVSYTASWYVGLYGAAASNTPNENDTSASHGGWTEVAPYGNATRAVCTFGTATLADPSVISNSASPAAFNVNAAAIVGGAFLISDSTKFGTTGVLFSAADFAAPGDRTVVPGDTVTVTYTFSLAAA
jgi:hypothetical protein